MPRVLVPIAPGVEEIEAVTVIDILRRAGVEVTVGGTISGPIEASRGVKLVADRPLDGLRAADFDMIVIPGGGAGTETLKNNPQVIQLLQEAGKMGKFTTAICAGPTVLHQAGLLSGKKATSHPSAWGKLEGATVLKDKRVVVDGKVITSQGPGTAMEFALQLVETLCGRETMEEVREKAIV